MRSARLGSAGSVWYFGSARLGPFGQLFGSVRLGGRRGSAGSARAVGAGGRLGRRSARIGRHGSVGRLGRRSAPSIGSLRSASAVGFGSARSVGPVGFASARFSVASARRRCGRSRTQAWDPGGPGGAGGRNCCKKTHQKSPKIKTCCKPQRKITVGHKCMGSDHAPPILYSIFWIRNFLLDVLDLFLFCFLYSFVIFPLGANGGPVLLRAPARPLGAPQNQGAHGGPKLYI